MSVINMFDFEDKLNELLKYTDDAETLSYQDEIMSSSNVINSFVIIENELNKIYEKTRMIEELIEYEETYVNNEIRKEISQCKKLALDISNLNDIIYNDVTNYKTINVPIENMTGNEYKDRDGTILPSARVNNSTIDIRGEAIQTFQYDLADIKSDSIPYTRNTKDFINHESPYRVVYLEDDIHEKGLSEELYFKFNTQSTINNVEINTSNCDVNKIIYVHADNSETAFDDISLGNLYDKNVVGVKIKILCKNYEKKFIKEYYFDDPIIKVDSSVISDRVSTSSEDKSQIIENKSSNEDEKPEINQMTKKELEDLFKAEVIQPKIWDNIIKVPSPIKYPIKLDGDTSNE